MPKLSQSAAYKKKAVLERIREIDGEISRGVEYLETGAHAHWHGFHPFFTRKIRNSQEAPPHRDWVKNVFIPSRQIALKRSEDVLERLEDVRTKR